MTPLLKIHHALNEVSIFTMAYQVLYNLAPASVLRFISHQILPDLSNLRATGPGAALPTDSLSVCPHYAFVRAQLKPNTSANLPQFPSCSK